jgi:hypothetical protein
MVIVTQGFGSKKSGVIVSQGYGDIDKLPLFCKGDVKAKIRKSPDYKLRLVKDG